jgi:hypothetical protein
LKPRSPPPRRQIFTGSSPSCERRSTARGCHAFRLAHRSVKRRQTPMQKSSWRR